MSEPTPSAWATDTADAVYCRTVEAWNVSVGGSLGDHLRYALAEALDAAELRGHTRAVEEIVTWLHAEVDAALSMRMPARASTFLAAAEALERGDHREEPTPPR